MIAEEMPTQTIPVVGKNPRLADHLVRAREGFLGLVSGAGRTRVVNHGVGQPDIAADMDLAAKLRQTLDGLKLQFMDLEGSNVDYAALSESGLFAEYRRECHSALRHFDPNDLQGEDTRRAFWINIYNALLIDAVVSLGVRESVTEGILGIFSFFRRAAYLIGGMRLSLEDMEHGILRGNRGNPFVPGAHFASDDERLAWAVPLDPRVHFALNCGSRSCPPIQSYSAEKLDEQLDLATRGFVSQDVAVREDRGEVQLSRIFRWYLADFNGRSGLIDFLTKYLPEDERQAYLLEARGNARLKFRAYDWRLNQV